MFLIKLPIRIALLPIFAAAMIIQLILSLIVGLSSIVTNLIGTVAIATAAGVWMFQLGTDADAYGLVAIGLGMIILPHFAGLLLEKLAGLTGTILAFITP